MGRNFILNKSNEEIIRNIYEQAYRTQLNYRGCSQVVVQALMDHLNMYNQEVFKAANAFGAGIARKGRTCGALIGALMGIGLCFGRSDLKEGGPPKEVGEIPYSTPYERTQDLAAEMFDRFEQFWGTAECRSIQVKVLGRTMDAADPDVKKMMESGEYFDMLSKVCCNVSASS